MDTLDADCLAHICSRVTHIDTRAAFAFFSCCKAHRTMLQELVPFAVLSLACNVQGRPRRVLSLPLVCHWFSVLTTKAAASESQGMRHTCRGTAVVASHRIFIAEEVILWRTNVAQVLVSAILTGNPCSCGDECLTTTFRAVSDKIEPFSGYGRFLALFQSTGTVIRLQNALTDRVRKKQCANNVVIVTRIPAPKHKIARLTLVISFEFKFHRESSSGPRDNNQFDDFIVVSNVRVHPASILVTSITLPPSP